MSGAEVVTWSRIASVVGTGIERAKFDLKRTLELGNRARRAHFVKDVLAMANTRNGPGYIIIGVLDNKERKNTDPEDYVVGYQVSSRDELNQLIAQTLDYFCAKPIPDVHYEEILHPQVDRIIGVVTVERAYDRPYTAKCNGDKLKAGEVYVRRNADTFTASVEEVQGLTQASKAGYRVILNYGRELTDSQVQQVEKLSTARVDEIINVPNYTLDDYSSYEEQLVNLVRSTGLTKHEWESLPLIINVHPFAPAATGILAQIHGVRGNFPSVLLMKRNDAGEFDVVEILNLQGLRNDIRNWAALQ